MARAVRGEDVSEVPCAGCTACCRSGQFVLVEPDESDTLAHLPPELLVPAPRGPDGHRVLATTAEGHCPMLVEGRCSIYAHRPRACRTYDCRIYSATGVDPGPSQAPVARRAARWQFSFDGETDRTEAEACRAAAAYLDRLDGAPGPLRLAAAAVEVHDLFVDRGADGTGRPVVTAAPVGGTARIRLRLSAGSAPS